MPIDKEQISIRLEKLREYYNRLIQYRKEAGKAAPDAMLMDAIERAMQVAIEAVIDIGEIIISNLKLVHDYVEIDKRLVLEHLKNDLEDFDGFAKAISKFIK